MWWWISSHDLTFATLMLRQMVRNGPSYLMGQFMIVGSGRFLEVVRIAKQIFFKGAV